MSKHVRVELRGIPHYTQGDHDGLCTYYAATMMMEALWPESFSGRFGKGQIRKGPGGVECKDPLFGQLGRGSDLKKEFYRWFFEGKSVEDAGGFLNKVAEQEETETRFTYREMKESPGGFKAIKDSIDRGLPVVLGWDTQDLGNHAVLVSGYEEGDCQWLVLHDPGGDTDAVEWSTLHSAKKSKLQVLFVEHNGLLPDKVVFEYPKDDPYSPKRTTFRWWKTTDGEQGWCDLKELRSKIAA